MGPITILDKSTLQSISVAKNEIIALSRYYSLNIVPVLYREILTDLSKDDTRKTSDTKTLAIKLSQSDTLAVNVEYRDIVLGNLLGSDVPFTGQILINTGEFIDIGNGEKALFYDEPKEKNDLRRWSQGKFTADELATAKIIRDGLSSINLEILQQGRWNIKQSLKHFNSENEVLYFVNRLSESERDRDQFNILNTIFTMIGLREPYCSRIVQRWLSLHKPAINNFAPYAAFFFRAVTFFHLCLTKGMISSKNTNLIDLEYLFYIPFCMVFSSGDNFLKQMAPFFLRKDQTFVSRDEFKADLANIAAFCEQTKIHMPQCPPKIENSITVKLWDKYLPNANDSSDAKPVSEEARRKAEQEMQKMIRLINAWQKK